MNVKKIRRVTRARDPRADRQLEEAIKESSLPPAHADTHSVSGADTITPSSIGAETPGAAQTKADIAESNAKNYTDEHENKSNPHDGSASTIALDDHINASNPHSGSQPVTSFTTADRPAGIAIGYMGFDIDLGIPIWWNGSDWIDVTGTVV